MKLRDAIYIAALFLRLDDVATAIKNASTVVTHGAEVQKEIDLLVTCGNLVVSEACERVPLKLTERVSSANGKIMLNTLSKSVTAVYALTQAGAKVPFKLRGGAITVKTDGEFELTYAYAPDVLTLESDMPHGELLPRRVISYGIAAEYCIINGISEEALLWNKRYYDGVSAAATPKHEQKMAARRWGI